MNNICVTPQKASFLSHGSRKKAASRPPTPRKRQTKANSALGGESQLCASPSSSKVQKLHSMISKYLIIPYVTGKWTHEVNVGCEASS